MRSTDEGRIAPDLTGRTALITGAGRGIGRATSLALARCGARVVVVARTPGDVESTAQEIQSMGGDAVAAVVDISRENDIERIFAETGDVDILVNNASVIQPIAQVADADPAEWRYDIAVNLEAVFLACHYALPSMVRRGWGRIVNVSSGAARGSVTGWSAYSAAKAGVEALTKVTALEVGDRGIRVNAVRPGIVDTDMQVQIRASSERQMGVENVERYRSYKERGKLRNPEDPAKLILWLLSPDAEHLNGEVLAIDDLEVAARIGLEPMGR